MKNILLIIIFSFLFCPILKSQNLENEALKAFVKGEKFRKEEKWKMALEQFDIAVAKNPSVYKYHYNKALCHLILRETYPAIASLEKTVSIKTDFVEAHERLARLYKHIKEYDKAIASYQNAFNYDTDEKRRTDYKLNIASLLEEIQRLEQDKKYSSHVEKPTSSESEQDIKDFIIEKIESSPPLNNYKNTIFFKNIIKIDAEYLSNRKLTDTDFDNSFISARQVFLDNGEILMEIAESIDLRKVTKISTTRNVGENNYYSIRLYLDGGGKKMTSSAKTKTTWEHMQYLDILITDDMVTAKKIKEAFLHLFKIKGINVKDGDLF